MKRRRIDQTQMVQIYTMVFVRVLMIILCVIAGLWILYRVRTLLVLLVISIFFAFFIAPVSLPTILRASSDDGKEAPSAWA